MSRGWGFWVNRLVKLSLGLVPLLAFGPAEAGNSSGFYYSSIAEAHLGGDDFQTQSVRADPQAKQVQVAVYTATGDLISLAFRDMATGSFPALPKKPKPAISDGGPELLSEGRGAVVTVARQKSGRRAPVVREIENADPTSVDPVDTAKAYHDALVATVSGQRVDAAPGMYVQLRYHDDELGVLPPASLSLDASNPLVALMAENPFLFVALNNSGSAADNSFLTSLQKGRSHVAQLKGERVILRIFELN